MNFKRLSLILILFAAAALPRFWPRPATPPEPAHVLERGVFELWTPFLGTLESVRSEAHASAISQPAALLMLAPEGSLIDAHDVVAVLDISHLRANLAALERDFTLAETELRSLREAELPLQLAVLEEELREAAELLQREERVRPRWEELADEGLLSPGELLEQADRLQRLRENAAARQNRLDLTRTVLHPARIEQAEARRESARVQVELLREQVAGAEIRAGIAGMVLHLPLHIGGEYRTAREGDTLFRNQEFLRVADMNHLAVTCLVPENLIALAPGGSEARVIPDAFPNLSLRAQVLSVGATAVSVPGRPQHEKFFVVSLLLEDSDPGLRTGMSARVHIRSRLEADSLLLPRHLLQWQGDRTFVRLAENTGATLREIRIDGGNERVFRVVEGLTGGERILAPERQ